MATVAQLLGSKNEVTDVLKDRLSGGVELPKVISHLIPFQDALVTVWDLLDTMRVEEILAVAWDRYKDIQSAKEETQGKPGATRIVRMAGRELRTVHKPEIECVIAGAKKTILTLSLTLTLNIEAVVVTVKEGRVSQIGPGTTTAQVLLQALSVPPTGGDITLFDKSEPMKVDLEPHIQPPMPKELDAMTSR